MATEKHTRSVNILFTQPEFARLEMLGEHLGVTRSAAARMALNAAYLMLLDQQPTCANGARCYVPHMHPPPAPTAQAILSIESPPHV